MDVVSNEGSGSKVEMEPYLNLLTNQLLTEVVEECRKVTETKEYVHCSIFLKEEGTQRFILKESSKASQFIGNFYIAIEPKDQDKFTCINDIEEEHPDLKERLTKGEVKKKDVLKRLHGAGGSLGIVKYAILSKKPYLAEDVRDDIRWSNFGTDISKLEKIDIGHCELPHTDTLSLIAIPIQDDKNEIIGAIRIVKRREHFINGKYWMCDSFNESNFRKIIKLINDYQKKIVATKQLDDYMDFYNILDVNIICNKMIHTIKSILKADGCSIFLLDIDSEDKLKYACKATTGLYVNDNRKISKVKSSDLSKAYYEYDDRCEHDELDYMTLTIKYKQNIIVGDISNSDSLNVPKNIARSIRRDRYFTLPDELDERRGSALYIPLLFRHWTLGYYWTSWDTNIKSKITDVLGVMVIYRKDQSFSDNDVKICVSLCNKLSRSILLSTFISLLNIIEGENDVNSTISINKLLKQICLVLGAPGASIFIKRDNSLINLYRYGYNKNIVYGLPVEKNTQGIGLTEWVALHNKIIFFNGDQNSPVYDINLNNIDKPGKMPLDTSDTYTEIGDENTNKFLFIPISLNNNVIGVLRIIKNDIDVPFSMNDLMLCSSLVNRIYPILKNINDNYNKSKNNISVLGSVFSPLLVSKIFEIVNKQDKNDIDAILIQMYKGGFTDRKEIPEFVTKVIEDLWRKCLTLSKQDQIGLYQIINDNILSDIPYYRDHFVHQLQVFLLGYYIMAELKEHKMPGHNTTEEDIAIYGWLMTSTCHDIAYPMQYINEWVPHIIYLFLCNKHKMPENGKILNIPKCEYRTLSKLENYIENKNVVWNSSYIGELFKSKNYKPKDGRDIIFYDHGVYGANYLLNMFSRETNLEYLDKVILPASFAISLHGKLLGNFLIRNDILIKYEEFPLAFMLLFCDMIQEWGRGSKDNFILTNLLITDKANVINKLINKQYAQKAPKDQTYVYCEIKSIDGLDEKTINNKILECKEVMGVLSSSNPCFIIKINDEVFYSDKNIKLRSTNKKQISVAPLVGRK